MGVAVNRAMISVEDALARVLAPLDIVPAEQIPVGEALGRVLAEDLAARVRHPPTAVSSMDGYAVRSNDLRSVPATLVRIGEIAAGKPFEGSLGPGQALRVFTGGVMPDGADAVLIQENARVSGDLVTATKTVESGLFVRPAGLDFSEGDVPLTAGKRLAARDLGLVASMNIPWVMVRRKPRIAVLSTGDEIRMPGDPLRAGQIVGSNAIAICAYVRALGGEPIDLGIAGDAKESLMEGFRAAAGADMIVTSGGASVGDYDIVAQVMGSDEMDLTFGKVAMRPGKPLISGRVMGTPMLGLPGNPVSSGVASALYLRHALDRMLGVLPENERGPRHAIAVLGADLGENDERRDYLRATLERRLDSPPVATPAPKQDSSMFATFAKADCLIVRPPSAPAIKAGETVTVMLLDMGVEFF